MILDFGVGQGGLLHGRPHHRTEAAIEQAIFHELHGFAGDHRLGLEIHGGVGPLEIPDLSQALDLRPLHIQPVRSELAALPPQHIFRNVILRPALGAEFLFHFPFDGQPMTVPAGHIGRVHSQHALRAHHKVFQYVIEAGAGMNVAIGIDRPVMKNEKLLPARLFPQFAVKVHLCPARQPFGLGLGQARLHGKIGRRQEQAGAVIAYRVLGGIRGFFRGKSDMPSGRTLLTE